YTLHVTATNSVGSAKQTLTVIVNQAATATTLALTDDAGNPITSSTYGQSVTFTATVTAANSLITPTLVGQAVTFYDGSTALGSGTLSLVNSTQLQATFTT